jgi:hypothetical protein
MEGWWPSEADFLGQSGKILNEAKADRMVADYDLVRGVANAEAAEMVLNARKFVDACKEKWNFYDKVTDELDD